MTALAFLSLLEEQTRRLLPPLPSLPTAGATTDWRFQRLADLRTGRARLQLWTTAAATTNFSPAPLGTVEVKQVQNDHGRSNGGGGDGEPTLFVGTVQAGSSGGENDGSSSSSAPFSFTVAGPTEAEAHARRLAVTWVGQLRPLATAAATTTAAAAGNADDPGAPTSSPGGPSREDPTSVSR